jgi:putative spermidine/putrescine transport system substrate-binding protein
MAQAKAGRRNFLGGLAAAALPMPAIAQGTKSFIVAAPGGLFATTLQQQVAPDFEAKYNVRVRFEEGTGSTFIPKMLTSPQRSPYDIVYVNDDEAFLGQSMGLWAPDQSAKLPNAARLYESLKFSHVPMYTSIVYEFPLVYTPAKMPEPTSWADLWKPGPTIGVPHISNTYGLIFLLIAAQLNGGDDTHFTPGFEALKRLQRMKIYRGVTQGFSMFQQGEFDAALFYGHRAQQLVDQGVPVKPVFPKEGVMGMCTGVQIPKRASAQELSLAWADATLGIPYQSAFAKLLYSPSNKDVPLSPELAAKHVTGEARVARIRYPDWNVINPQRDDLLSAWTRIFG